jgi:esterase/lipase/1-acyl-sn-glycerol-3-phosphate acyltransferase
MFLKQSQSSENFKYTAIALRILEKIFNSKFSVEGVENLPNQPIIFVSNHFTRCETFFVPYVINKYTKKQIRCLADASLYKGLLGQFLTSVGTISTKQKGRDNIILKNLILGEHDWMIYPEGSMIKSKQIEKKGNDFVNYTPSRIGKVRTGSSVLAIKSELYRYQLVEAFEKKQLDVIATLKKELDIEYLDKIKTLNTHIVPVTITYYPIRPGDNRIKNLISRLVKKVPPNIAEEIEIETNLLLSAEINICFGQAISLNGYINNKRDSIYKIPIIKDETKTNIVVKYYKTRLTNKFMEVIYYNLQINLDHLFSAALFYLKESEVSLSRLKRIIYLSAVMIKGLGKNRINNSINEENLFKIFLNENHQEFDSIFNLAKNLKIITQINDNKIRIDKVKLEEEHDFHQIRLENTLHVILNEFLLIDIANNVIRRNIALGEEELKTKIKHEIFNQDLEIFNDDHRNYFDLEFSKDKSIGRPFILNIEAGDEKLIKKGALICHGYKSSPMEVLELSSHIHKQGYEVYAPRLKGHGTSPLNLRDVTWKNWYDSVQRGFAFLQTSCSKTSVIGFSTGALLALMLAAKNPDNISSLILINAPLRLRDIRAKMVLGLNLWNETLEKLHIKKGRLEYIDDHPENPITNYNRNYLNGVQELEKLMSVSEGYLSKISVPTLIIQAKNDPVVNPKSAQIIYDKIACKEKKLVELDLSNHVIINGDKKEEVFKLIQDFI